MISPQAVSIIIPYQIVDPKTGHWESPRIPESLELVVPKFVSELTKRLEKIISHVVFELQSTMSKNMDVRKSHRHTLIKSIEKASNEIRIHVTVCNKFTSSALCYARKEISLEGTLEILNKSLCTLEKTVYCFDQLMNMYDQNDPKEILENMKIIKGELNTFANDNILHVIYEAFFFMDDASRGLVRTSFTGRVMVHPEAALDKYMDCILRNSIKGVDSYVKSHESKMVDTAFERIWEIQKEEDPFVQVLLKLKKKLEESQHTTFDGFNTYL